MKESRPSQPTTARTYVAVVIAFGFLAVTHSLLGLFSRPVSPHWFVLAGLTLLSGSFTVRIPTIPARLSVSEAFVFAAVLLFGPSAATPIVVLDSLVISLWLKPPSRRLSRTLFNMAAPAISIWIAAHAFYWLADIRPLAESSRPILSLVAPLSVLAILYFLLNSFLIAAAIGLEQGLSVFSVWRRNFLWLSLNYFSGASVAALLLPYLQADYLDFFRGFGVLLPLLFISYLTFKTALGRVDDANRHLNQVNELYLSTIETLAMAIDAKDQITHGHIRRVQTYAVQLAKNVGVHDTRQIRAIEAAALLHDMGKLAVPEYILNKPGPLTAAEFERMKLHASVGADILKAIDFPYPVVPIVRHHHENWDGTGYPDGLAGADIPIGARILSVVDCYDALTSDRPYRPRLSDTEAISILLERRGSMYDPLIVDAFLALQPTLASAEESPLTERHPTGVPTVRDSKPAEYTLRSLDEITGGASEMQEVFHLARSLAAPQSEAEPGQMLQHVRRLIPYSCGVLYLYDQEHDDLWSADALGEQFGLLKGIRIRAGQRLSGWVAANRQPIRNSDPVLDLGDAVRRLNPRLQSALSVPLIADNNLKGVISLYSTERNGFTEQHQRILEILAPHMAASVSRQPGTTQEQYSGDVASGQIAPIELGPGTPFGVVNVFRYRTTSESSHEANAEHEVVEVLRKNMRPRDLLLRHSAVEQSVVLMEADRRLSEAITTAIREELLKNEKISSTQESPFIVTFGITPADGTKVGELVRSLQTKREAMLKYQQGSLLERPGSSIH